MTVAELVEKLSIYRRDMRVWVWDGDGDVVDSTVVEPDQFEDDEERILFIR